MNERLSIRDFYSVFSNVELREQAVSNEGIIYISIGERSLQKIFSLITPFVLYKSAPEGSLAISKEK
jgi:hypothetical protein